MKVHVVSAFTSNGNGGNIAGIVLLKAFPSDNQMQAVASQAGYSETAFVTLQNSNVQHIRFFAPSKEVSLCGHATIASYAWLKEHGKIPAGMHTMICPAGPQKIRVSQDGKVAMSQNLPSFGSKLAAESVASSLGIETIDIDPDLPLQIASTGLNKIFVPLRSIDALYRIKPNFQQISDVSIQHNAIGMYCYTTETRHQATAHCRNFAPVVGILEDSATGTSAAALSTLLYHHHLLGECGVNISKPILHCTYEQGYAIDCPAELLVQLHHTPKDHILQEVWVSGYAKLL